MDIRETLKEAFNLGIFYRMQSNSDFASDHKNADTTLKKFNNLVDKICNELDVQPQEPVGFYLHSSRVGGPLRIGTINGKPIEDARVSYDKTFYAYDR